MGRTDGRGEDELRPVCIQTDFVGTAAGSCLISCGGTRVICTASVEDGVPPFLRGAGCGWLTAEYAMLPASTGTRKARDGIKKDGRGVEISRLIGRSLRQALDRERLGERTVTIDCDVLEADGGTRTASVTGGFVALCLAVDRLIREGRLRESPIVRQVAAVSAGIVGGVPCLDLCRVEDSAAETDMNAVLGDREDFIELQGTGEGRPFSRREHDILLSLMAGGARRLMQAQREALGEKAYVIGGKRTLVVATGNPNKLREFRELLGDRYRVIGMREAGFEGEVAETADSFEGNAVLKAERVRDAAGYLTLADDSGLQVDALGGEPGVRSARYAGEGADDAQNNLLLLGKLSEVPAPRTARFVCVLALASPFAPTRIFRGECPGRIAFEPRGGEGFGYDPLFEHGSGKTFAEMGEEEKNEVSHRSRAVEKLLEAIG